MKLEKFVTSPDYCFSGLIITMRVLFMAGGDIQVVRCGVQEPTAQVCAGAGVPYFRCQFHEITDGGVWGWSSLKIFKCGIFLCELNGV